MRQLGVVVLSFVCACSSSDIAARSTAVGDGGESSDARSEQSEVTPEYDATGALQRPVGWEQWVFLGSALNLSYESASPPPTDTLSAAYMEPSAFRHFKTTGEFREGTMTVVTAYATTTAGPPALGGVVPTNLVAFEMSVKDRQRTPEGWGYYHFDASSTASAGAQPRPRAECFDCHDQHAETDHVFTQYYPALP